MKNEEPWLGRLLRPYNPAGGLVRLRSLHRGKMCQCCIMPRMVVRPRTLMNNLVTL